jgi:hypothetical protein
MLLPAHYLSVDRYSIHVSHFIRDVAGGVGLTGGMGLTGGCQVNW